MFTFCEETQTTHMYIMSIQQSSAFTASAHRASALHALTYLPNRGRVWMVRPWQVALILLCIILKGNADILHGSAL